SPGKTLFCHIPRPLTKPLKYTGPRNPRSKLVGFGLATSGPVSAGVVIAVGAAGCSAAGAGCSSANTTLASRPSDAQAQTTPGIIPLLEMFITKTFRKHRHDFGVANRLQRHRLVKQVAYRSPTRNDASP